MNSRCRTNGQGYHLEKKMPFLEEGELRIRVGEVTLFERSVHILKIKENA